MKTSTDHSLISEIFSNLGQMVWSKDISAGQISFLTDNFTPVFEVPMEKLRMEPSLLSSCIHPDDLPFIDLFSKALLSHGTEQSEYRIITTSGKTKWILEKKRLVKNDLGEIIRLDALLFETTDQKEEEFRLLDSETTFKSLFYRHPVPMWVYDTESLYFLAVNDAAVKFYGYTHDEFFRMTVRQIRPEEDVEELLSAIRDNNFENYSGKSWRHLKKDGSHIFVKISSNPINFRGQNARLVLALDITSQIEAEAKTEKIYTYLEKFQEAVSKTNLLAMIDQKGKLSFANQNLLEKSNSNSPDIIGKSWTNLLSKIYSSDQNQTILNHVGNGKIWRGQKKFKRKNGPDFWTNCSIIPIVEELDSALQYLLIADDISDLKEAEKRNREYAIKLHNILEGVTDAIFVLDKKWILTNFNFEAEHLFEKNGNQLLGKNIWEIFPAEEGYKFYQFFRKAKKKRVTVEFEEYYEPKCKWYDISVYPSKDGLVICFRDVSDRKAKEEETKLLTEHLALQNRNLEEFTYITSHSLRAQIANISMLCSAIDAGGMTPLNQEIFEKLFQSSGNLDTVIADLNTILTVKSSRAILFEEISIQNSFLNATNRIPQEFNGFKKYIKTDFESDLQLKSVRIYIETILVQLIINAIKFRSMDKEPEIIISTLRKNDQIIIKVRDNGRGMDLKKIDSQIFKLYKTFSPGTSGKGLGLYLCKILTEELKGKLTVESTPEKGTCFSLILPGI